MLDLKAIRQNPDDFKTRLARKGIQPNVINDLLSADETKRELQQQTESLKAQQNEASKSIAGVTSALQLDLADKASVVDCAEQLRRLNAPIDMLICNAGYRGGSDEAQLVNGVEKHMAINHFGHFLLVNRLLDEQKLREFLGERLAHFEVPRYFHQQTEVLPRTASGKLFKKQWPFFQC